MRKVWFKTLKGEVNHKCGNIREVYDKYGPRQEPEIAAMSSAGVLLSASHRIVKHV